MPPAIARRRVSAASAAMRSTNRSAKSPVSSSEVAAWLRVASWHRYSSAGKRASSTRIQASRSKSRPRAASNRARYFRAGRYTFTRLSSHACPSGTGVRPSIHAVDGIPRSTSPDDVVPARAAVGLGAGTIILAICVGHMLASRHEKRSGGQLPRRPAPCAGDKVSPRLPPADPGGSFLRPITATSTPPKQREGVFPGRPCRFTGTALVTPSGQRRLRQAGDCGPGPGRHSRAGAEG